MHILRNGFHQGIQFLKLILRQIIFQKGRPVQGNFLHVGHRAGFNHLGMDQFEQLNAHFRHFVHRLFLPNQQLGKAGSVQQFKYRAISAAFNPYHVIGNGGGNACHKGSPGQFPLPVNLRQRVRIQVHFDNGIPVDPVYFSVRALSDHFASFNRKHAVGSLNLHHVRKAGHVQDVVYFPACVNNLCVVHILFQSQNDAKPGACGIFQLFTVDNDMLRRMFFQNPAYFPLDLGRVGRINAAFDKKGQFFSLCFVVDVNHRRLPPKVKMV